MKTKLIAAGLFLLTATLGSARIMEVDYNIDNIIKLLLNGRSYALVGGWEDDWSNGYALGGRSDLHSLVQTDYFANKPTDIATISWQFPEIPELTNLADLVRVRAAVAYGESSGPVLYEVTGHSQFNGQVTFTLDGPISQLYLFGNQFVPDTGSTLCLLALALAALALLRRKALLHPFN